MFVLPGVKLVRLPSTAPAGSDARHGALAGAHGRRPERDAAPHGPAFCPEPNGAREAPTAGRGARKRARAAESQGQAGAPRQLEGNAVLKSLSTVDFMKKIY